MQTKLLTNFSCNNVTEAFKTFRLSLFLSEPHVHPVNFHSNLFLITYGSRDFEKKKYFLKNVKNWIMGHLIVRLQTERKL